jgi:GxxExxY protein
MRWPWVEGCVIVELKAVEQIATEHHAQLLNYLKATDIDIGLLLITGGGIKATPAEP